MPLPEENERAMGELPKFVQMANRVRDRILSGDLRPGDEVPSERALATEWGVARPTAARALQELRSLGLVESRQGSGSYVREGTANVYRRAKDRYARSASAGRVYAEGEWARIVAAKRAQAPGHVAKALGVDEGSTVGRRQRILGDGSGPTEISTSWFPIDIVEVAPNLMSRNRIREGSLAYIESCTGRRGQVARDQLSARMASAAERRELYLDNPSAVLVVLHVVVDRKNQPLEVVDAVYPPAGRWFLDQEYPLGS